MNRIKFLEIINEMWSLFISVASIDRRKEIERYIALKDRAAELLSEESKDRRFRNEEGPYQHH